MHLISQLRVYTGVWCVRARARVCVCVCLCVCPAHLWGRSGCSRTLEWHTAPSSAALSCHQQNAQSEPATYCEKRISAICVSTSIHVVHLKIFTHHTCVQYMHTDTQYAHTTHTHTFLSSNSPFSLSLVACDGARGSLPLDRVDSLVTCSRMLS